nr:MAG TPA: hypothetical protein [Caudoviricetes sp.]
MRLLIFQSLNSSQIHSVRERKLFSSARDPR